jgi:hypothetical protein
MPISHSETPAAEYTSDVDRTVEQSRDSPNASRTATIPGYSVPASLRSEDNPDTGCEVARRVRHAQEKNISFHLAGVAGGGGCNRKDSLPVTKPLLVQCDDCSGAGRICLGHANDPWAKAWTCSACDGTGEVIAGCACCREDATEWVDGATWCPVHAAEQKADALLDSADV